MTSMLKRCWLLALAAIWLSTTSDGAVFVPPLRRVALTWEETKGPDFQLPAGARYAVVVVAPPDKRDGLPTFVDKWAKPRGFKRLSYKTAELPKVVKLFVLDPAAAPEVAKRLGWAGAGTAATVYLSPGGAVMLKEDGIPQQAKPSAFLASLLAIENMTPKRLKEIDKLLSSLGMALMKSGMKKDAAPLAAMRPSLAAKDFDGLEAVRRTLDAVAAVAAERASNDTRLTAVCGDKKGALAQIDALERTFAAVPPALEVLAKVRKGIENDEVSPVLVDWPGGGAIGVAYYTGKGAQKLKAFEKIGMAVSKEIGLPYKEIHAADVLGNANDPNGALLYPDGSARVRLLIMPGGQAHDTWLEIGGKDGNPKCRGRELFQQAFKTGMNYIGTCGGCFMGCGNFDVPRAFNSHLSLWPGRVRLGGLGRKDPPPDMVFDKAHPLAAATRNGELKKVFFNGGPQWLEPDIPGTEYIAKFRGGGLETLWGQWALIAYSPPGNAGGRIVACAAHPEARHVPFVKAMADYSLDHRYLLPRRPVKSGETLKAISGDGQIQCYEIQVPAGATRLEVTLSGMDGNCDLYARRCGLPGPSRADARSASPADKDEKISVAKPKAGLWFLAVHGNHKVAAGVKYSLTATLE